MTEQQPEPDTQDPDATEESDPATEEEVNA